MHEHASRSTARSPRDRVIRYIGLALGGFIGWQFGVWLTQSGEPQEWGPVALLFGAVIGGIFFIIAPYVVSGTIVRLRRKFATMPAIDIVAAGFGLIAGGILASLLALPASMLPDPFGQTLPFIVAIIACTLSVFVVVLRKNDLASLLFRRSPIDVPDEKLLLDTSVIIDGRIVDLMRTGIVTLQLAVPQFVLRELQGIADSSDPSRKARGRRGLDTLDRLRREGLAEIEFLDVEVDEEHTVDNKLVRLAQLSRYSIFTGDQNLERVAKLQGVAAINVNSLAQALRPPVVAGEEIEIEIVQPGRERGQGIGFLEDGTLVVVEEGETLIGRDARVVVTRTLQTGTGRMAFATIKDGVVAP
ncbi:MAG: PIN/TRAM domain-containing protein [Chloroflexota bacterium]